MKLLYISNGYPPHRWAGTENYTAGTSVTLTAAPTTGSTGRCRPGAARVGEGHASVAGEGQVDVVHVVLGG